MNPLGALFHKVKKNTQFSLIFFLFRFFATTTIIIIVIIIYTVPQSCWWMHMTNIISFSPISNYGQYSGLEHVLDGVLGNVWNHYTWIWLRETAISKSKIELKLERQRCRYSGPHLLLTDRDVSTVVCRRSWDADTCSRETLQRCREHRRTRGMYPPSPSIPAISHLLFYLWQPDWAIFNV